MKTRTLGVLTGLAISFALPTYAQQKDLADPQTTQKIHAIGKAFDEAINNHDAAAIAALYTRNAVFVTTKGPITGRQAIQKWWTDLYQSWDSKNHISNMDGNAPHLIGTAGNELWATGEWSETGQGKNREPIPIKGHWALIYVREADDWKIRVHVTNDTPDSVILINKSLGNQTSGASQPAATPPPTASPSNQ
jgi:ketosteroid isomerase-like protein